jgi:hypothetical protein
VRIRSASLTGIASILGLIALTVGFSIAGIPVVYLLPLFTVALAAVGIWSAWNGSQLHTGDVAPRRPAYWFLLALGYTVVAVAVLALAWCTSFPARGRKRLGVRIATRPSTTRKGPMNGPFLIRRVAGL